MTEKMNVVIVGPIPPPYGGVGNWVLMLDEYTANRDDVNFLHINTAPLSRGLDGRSLWDRVVVQGFIMLKKSNELRRLINDKRPKAIHITTSGQLAIIRDTQMLRIAKKHDINSIYHMRFGRIPEIAKANTKEWRLLKKAIMLARHVIAIDIATEAAIKEYCPNSNVSYVPNPFDLSKLDSTIQRVSDEVSFSKEVIFIGWLVKTKGIDELLTAWGSLSERYPEWRLRIIGPAADEYMKELKSKYVCHNVIFDGEQSHEDAMRSLEQASIAALPSYTEGFPNFVLEAMALKKPIVATNVGAIPEMLKDCGIVIRPKKAEELANALETFITDPELRFSYGELARAKLESQYSLQKVFELYKEVWQK